MSRRTKSEASAGTAEESLEDDIRSLEDLCLLDNDQIAVADHANGILIFSCVGRLVQHLSGQLHTLAFSVRYNAAFSELLALILDVPGWIVNKYTFEKGRWKLQRQLPLPDAPSIPRMKMRWLSVSKRGDVFVTAASAIWQMDRNDWSWTSRSLLFEATKNDAWLSNFTCTNDPATFYVCAGGEKLLPVTCGDDGSLKVADDQVIVFEEIHNMGDFTTDEEDNFLVSDFASGKIILFDAKRTKQKEVGELGKETVHVMAAKNRRLYVGCKNTLQILSYFY